MNLSPYTFYYLMSAVILFLAVLHQARRIARVRRVRRIESRVIHS